MPTWAFVVIAVAVAAAIVLVVVGARSKRRSHRLQSTFSSEYDRTVADLGGRRPAEQELLDRENQRDQLRIEPLSAAARERYAERWRTAQATFVDSPQSAVREANELVEEVMRQRGYPIADFEQQAAVISVDHADVVADYRAAHQISLSAAQGTTSTENLRLAMQYYRALFENLLGGTGEEEAPEAVGETQTAQA